MYLVFDSVYNYDRLKNCFYLVVNRLVGLKCERIVYFLQYKSSRTIAPNESNTR